MQRAGTDVREKARKKIGKRLLNNLGLKLISVVFAVVIWFLVVMISNPKDSVTFSGIQVNLINTELLEAGDKIYDIKDNTDKVRVTVEAPRNVINQLRSSDIVAEADVSRLTEVNTIAISCRVLNEDVEISSVTCSPELMSLNVEEKAKKWVNVRHNTVGEVAEGYMVASVSSEQTRVEVLGPQSVVEKISYVGLEIDVTGATENVSGNVDVRFYNVEGQMLDDSRITKNVDSIHMEVRVLATKEVPFELNYTGTPAEGYLATGEIICDRPTVMIAGSAATLADITKVTIPERELDITDKDEDYEKTIDIRKYLDNNVILADSGFNGRITVRVAIEEEAGRTLVIPEANITLTNLPAGYDAALTEGQGAIRLRISGLGANVSAVDQNAIGGTVDIGKWMQSRNMASVANGAYDIPVDFTITDHVNIEGEVTVKVNIVRIEEDEE